MTCQADWSEKLPVQLPLGTPSCENTPAIVHHPSRVSKTAAAPKTSKRRVTAKRKLLTMLSQGKISDQRIARQRHSLVIQHGKSPFPGLIS